MTMTQLLDVLRIGDGATRRRVFRVGRNAQRTGGELLRNIPTSYVWLGLAVLGSAAATVAIRGRLPLVSGRKVRDVMVSDVVTIDASATLLEAAQKMRDGNVGMLPVVENGRLRGGVAARDLVVRAMARNMDIASTPVRYVSTDDLSCARPNCSIEDAMQLMADDRVGRLPVVDDHDRVIGIVTLSSLALRSREHGHSRVAEDHTMDYLRRHFAPLSDTAWKALDIAVVQTARHDMSARHLGSLDGPKGWEHIGARVGTMRRCRTPESKTSVCVPDVVLLAELRADFSAPWSAIETFARGAPALDVRVAETAARAVALAEDVLLFYGEPTGAGSLTSKESPRIQIGDWSRPGRLLSDLLDAVQLLDTSGIAGPYEALLTAAWYYAYAEATSEGGYPTARHLRHARDRGRVLDARR